MNSAKMYLLCPQTGIWQTVFCMMLTAEKAGFQTQVILEKHRLKDKIGFSTTEQLSLFYANVLLTC